MPALSSAHGGRPPHAPRPCPGAGKRRPAPGPGHGGAGGAVRGRRSRRVRRQRRRLSRRATGKPIRVASKSVRCRGAARAGAGAQRRLPRARCRSRCPRRCGWPRTDSTTCSWPIPPRTASRCARWRRREAAARITVMVDCVEHLDLIDASAGGGGTPVRVCMDLDARWARWAAGCTSARGVRRCARRRPAAALARQIVARPALRAGGLMAYEAQIAGLGDPPPGRPAPPGDPGAAARVGTGAGRAPRRGGRGRARGGRRWSSSTAAAPAASSARSARTR